VKSVMLAKEVLVPAMLFLPFGTLLAVSFGKVIKNRTWAESLCAITHHCEATSISPASNPYRVTTLIALTLVVPQSHLIHSGSIYCCPSNVDFKF